MQITGKKIKAFSLIELLAAIVISSMVLIAVLGTYTRVQRSSAAIINRLDSTKQPRDVLQLIAKDLDEVITGTGDAQISFQNKIDLNGNNQARLEITKSITDKTSSPVPFEKIVWQTAYDYDSDTPGMVLYRSHDGLTLEDKLLDQDKLPFDRSLFVPVCPAVTLFRVQTRNAENLTDNWMAPTLPPNIVVTISFDKPVEIAPNQWEIPDNKKTVKTIVIDRMKKIPFVIEHKESPNDANYIQDANQPNAGNFNKPGNLPNKQPNINPNIRNPNIRGPINNPRRPR
jgi:type II secretory pathway component PulJ